MSILHEIGGNQLNIDKILDKWVSFFPRQEKAFRTNLIRVAFSTFLIWLVLPVQSIYLSVIGASASQVGWITGMAGVVGGFMSFFTGIFVHKYGIKIVFLFGTLTVAVGGLIVAGAVNLLIASIGVVIFLSFWYNMKYLCRVVCGSCLEDNERAMGMAFCDTLSRAFPRTIATFLSGILVTIFGGYSVSGIKPLYLMQFILPLQGNPFQNQRFW